MEATGVKLLWGTANLFCHPRYMAGAATNPDPEVFAYAAAQVKNVLDATHELDGANYVLWGGREGYETLLNTDLKRELEQLGRFLTLVVEHKHKIGFKGVHPDRAQAAGADQAPVRLTTSPRCTASCSGSASRTRSRSTSRSATRCSPHQPSSTRSALAAALGIFGSIDTNRGDYQSGWDTDQFPNNAAELALALYTSSRTAASRRAASTSTPRCAASRSTRTTCCSATSAASTSARRRCSAAAR